MLTSSELVIIWKFIQKRMKKKQLGLGDISSNSDLRIVIKLAQTVLKNIFPLLAGLCTYLGSSAWGLFLMMLTPTGGHSGPAHCQGPPTHHSPYLHKTPGQHKTPPDTLCLCPLSVPALIRTAPVSQSRSILQARTE